jgi:histone deacetylase 1/2
VYLGPSPHHKGHKCLSHEGKVYVYKDVVFNELEFPYTQLFSKSSDSDTSQSFSTWSTIIPTPPPTSTTASPPCDLVDSHTLADQSSPTSLSPQCADVLALASPQSLAITPSSPTISPPAIPSPQWASKRAIVKPANTHPMVTRCKTGNLKPKVLLAHSEPISVKQALSEPQWVSAM